MTHVRLKLSIKWKIKMNLLLSDLVISEFVFDFELKPIADNIYLVLLLLILWFVLD